MRTFKELNQWIEDLEEEVELDELKMKIPNSKGWVLGTKDEPPKPKDKDIVWRSKVHHWDSDVRSDDTRLIIVDTKKSGKDRFQMWAVSDKSGKVVFHFGAKPTLDDAKAFASIRKWQQKEEVEIEEAEIATSIGSGGTAGLDMGLTYKKKKEDVKKAKALRKQMMGESVQRTTFAGKDVFIVDSETFYNCRLGKKKYGRYEKYVGKGKVGQTIREYGLKYPRRPIILQNGESGPMLFLKYGRS